MTANKRRKNKTRAIMEATGTNYVRAARIAGFTSLKDPVNLSWSPGTVAVNQTVSTVYDKFDNSSPVHLLIAGMSSAEPEMLLRDLIDQLIENNTPQDIRLSIIEPAIALKNYETGSHTERYVDSWTSGGFVSNVAEVMGDAVEEMERRYELFVNHESNPKNLRMARSIAIKESLANGTPATDHALYLPYKFIVVHESSVLFEETQKANEREDHRRTIIAAHELSRKARAAGIYLVFSTQYPAFNACPTPIRDHMRSIYLSAPNEEVSTLYVGDNSCFELPKTKGIQRVSNWDGSIKMTTIFDRNREYLPYSVLPESERYS